jgi:hypothetical protein
LAGELWQLQVVLWEERNEEIRTRVEWTGVAVLCVLWSCQFASFFFRYDDPFGYQTCEVVDAVSADPSGSIAAFEDFVGVVHIAPRIGSVGVPNRSVAGRER